MAGNTNFRCWLFRKDFENITEEVETKTIDQVKEYSVEFWARYTELPDSEKIIAGIERGETKLQKIIDTQNMLNRKLAQSKRPLFDLTFSYAQAKSKYFTEDEDRFLVRLKSAFFNSDLSNGKTRIRQRWDLWTDPIWN